MTEHEPAPRPPALVPPEVWQKRIREWAEKHASRTDVRRIDLPIAGLPGFSEEVAAYLRTLGHDAQAIGRRCVEVNPHTRPPISG